MRHAGSIIGLLIFVSLSAHCQRLVSGSVLDGETKQGIPFAAVHIENSTIGVSCDEMGIFSLYIPQEKENASVVISALGYRPDTMYIQKMHGNKCVATLQSAAIQLGGVEVVEYATARKLMDAILERIPQNYRTDEAVGIWHYRSRRLLNDSLYIKAQGLARNYMPPYGKMLRYSHSRDTSKLNDELYHFYQSLDSVLYHDKPLWHSLVGSDGLDEKMGIAGIGGTTGPSVSIGSDFVNYMKKTNLRIFSKKSTFLMETFLQDGVAYYRMTISYTPRGLTLCDTIIAVINKDELAIVEALHIHPSSASYAKPGFMQKYLHFKDVRYYSKTRWRYHKYNGKYQLDFIQTENEQWIEFSEKAEAAGCKSTHLKISNYEEFMLSTHSTEGVEEYKQRYLNSKNPRSKENVRETERILRELGNTIPW